MNQPDIIGRLGSTHGVRGWLRIHSFTDVAKDIFSFSQHLLCKSEGQWQPVKITQWRVHRDAFLCHIEGVDSREDAQLWVGREIAIMPEHLPTLPSDEYYWRDLTGCRIKTEQGYDMGVVNHLMETGANDVLVVKANANDAFNMNERLLPFLPGEVIKTVDIANKSIIVDWDPNF